MKELTKGPNLGTLLQQFFVEYMMQQRHASARSPPTAQMLLHAAGSVNVPAHCHWRILTQRSFWLNYLETDRHNAIRVATPALPRFVPSCTTSVSPSALAILSPFWRSQ